MTAAIDSNPNSTELIVKLDIPVELELVDGSSERVNARIYRLSAGLVELSSPVYFPHNQELQILNERHRIQSRVVYCRSTENNWYDLALRMEADSYIRTEPRIPANLQTHLHILGSPTPIDVRVVDLSASGIGMELAVSIPVGARVAVSIGYSTALGEIRHCARKGYYYRAGIRLEKLVRRRDANLHVWTDLNSSSGNTAAVAEFARSVEEKQLAAEAMLLSLAMDDTTDDLSDE